MTAEHQGHPAILQWPQWCDPNVASPRTGYHDGNSRQAPDQEIGRRFPINLVQLCSTMFNLLHFVWKSLKSVNKLEHQLALKTQGWASQCSQTGLEPHRCTRLHHDFLMGFLGGGRGQISFQTLPLIFEVSYVTVEIPGTLITYYNLWMLSFCTICYLCFVANRMHPDALSFFHWSSPWRAWRAWRAWRGRRICKPRSESAWAFERPKMRRVCSPAVLCSIAICLALVAICCNMLQSVAICKHCKHCEHSNANTSPTSHSRHRRRHHRFHQLTRHIESLNNFRMSDLPNVTSNLKDTGFQECSI